MDNEVNPKRNSIKKILFRMFILIVTLIGIFGLLFLIARHFGLTSINRDKLQALIEKTGAWGPVVFIIISFLQVTFIPVPSTVTIVIGNYLFGAWLSFFYSYIGIILGSSFAFMLGRIIGRSFVDWVIGDKQTVDEYLKKLKGKENIVLFFMFLFPFFPDDALCAVAGILPIKILTFFIMQLITRATTIGGNLLFLSGEIIPFSGWGIPVIITLCIIALITFIICYRNAEKINDFFYRFINKAIDKLKKGRSKHD